MKHTYVTLPAPLRAIEPNSRLVFLGSCFAQNIGAKFAQAGLHTTVCPTGAVYCPHALTRILQETEATAVSGAEGWHTWLTNTTLRRPTKAEAEATATQALRGLHADIRRATHLFLTLGTSRAYILRETGEVVCNCHKHPAREFLERDFSAEEITNALHEALVRLKEQNPHLVVVITISPYRYVKYGLHESQLAKARLLLAADALCQRHPQWVQYLPAYEIVLDELRDYTWYAPDGQHVAPETAQHLWNRILSSPLCKLAPLNAEPLSRVPS